MDTSPHTLTTLFDQLGLPSWEEAIDRFIEEHTPIAAEVSLADAGFWTSAQRAFLQEALVADSDWTGVVDQLDTLLRDRA